LRTTRAVTVSASGFIGNALRIGSTPALATPWTATSSMRAPSKRDTTLMSAPHSLSASSPIRSNTAPGSPGASAISRRTSPIAA
jgi:hypothetical protein